MKLRRLRPDDDLNALTALLHSAYAPLAAQGLAYVATHQSVEITAKRAARGECWVAVDDGQLIATATLCAPGTGAGCQHYRRPDVATVAQVAVHPDRQGQGVGAALLAHVEARAGALDARELALDTAIYARQLIAMYNRRGYRFVQHIDWRPHTNYTSVVLSKALDGSSAGGDVPGWPAPPSDPWAERDTIHALFERTWPGLPAMLAHAAELGAPLEDVSVPFRVGHAHVGVFHTVAVVDGQSTVLAGIHAVCTHPDHRGQGHGRRALAAALDHVDARWPVAYLTTAVPAFFEPAGFRVVPEHHFTVSEAISFGTGAAFPAATLEQVQSALHRRDPVSHRLASMDQGWLLLIDEVIGHGGLTTFHAWDGGVVAFVVRDDTLLILDVVGEVPPLSVLAPHLPSASRVMLGFCPDRLGVMTQAEPTLPDGGWLMVRGDLGLRGPLTMPFHARG